MDLFTEGKIRNSRLSLYQRFTLGSALEHFCSKVMEATVTGPSLPALHSATLKLPTANYCDGFTALQLNSIEEYPVIHVTLLPSILAA
jgi:hypothetical protein